MVFKRHVRIILTVNDEKRNTGPVQYPLAEKREFGNVLDPFFKTKYSKGV